MANPAVLRVHVRRLDDVLFVEDGVDDWNPTWGVAGGFLGEVFGLEAELALAPGFFESFASAVPGGPPEQLLAEGSLATLMGHVVVALPRRLAQSSLRPYLSGGAGIDAGCGSTHPSRRWSRSPTRCRR